jgi:Kdo2-lipid IVA lauroyltransferase/acyltransferase
MQRISYYLFLIFVYLFGIIPFSLLYIVSFKVYILLYYIIGYRKKVVYSNLTKAFPGKSETEIKILVKKFYKHLADIFIESLKGFSMSHEEIVRRHKIVNMSLLDKYVNAGKPVIAIGGHYGNWEWGSMSGGLQSKCPLVIFYKPISNKFINDYMIRTRSRCGTIMASISKTYQAFKQQEATPSFFLLIADQSPTRLDKAYWITFLGIDTAFLHGPEQYARKLNYPVFFVDIKRVKRSFYELELVPIIENPSDLPDGEITARYANLLEARILKEPEFWLWSHRRWKHTRKAESSIHPETKMSR